MDSENIPVPGQASHEPDPVRAVPNQNPAARSSLLRNRRRIPFELRVLALGILIGLPGSACALALLLYHGYPAKVVFTVALALAGCWLGGALAVRNQIVHAFRTLSNMLMALREGDFSIRAVAQRRDDVLGEVFQEINAFSDALRTNRLDALEATALMRKVMAEIDVAVFAFGDDTRLRFLNTAAEKLIGMSQARALDRTAEALGIERCLRNPDIETMELELPGGHGRFGIRRGAFRLGGMPHHVLLLTNLSQTLRQEEREAWQRLVRVLGHEINNSLTPIKSMAGSLASIIQRDPLPPDWKSDAAQVLSVIESRADALGRFTASYARLAKLPKPAMQFVDIEPIVRRVSELETRVPVTVAQSAPVRIEADPDQLEQALINLVRNAADAAILTQGAVEVAWSKQRGAVEIRIRDTGPGISSGANLFVPFFTTKPSGSGIGLVLSRQIAEAHGGSLSLGNAPDGPGAVATLRLPV